MGRVLGARGVRGELKVAVLTDFPERFQRGATVWAAGEPRTVRGARNHLGALLLLLDGIDTREEAAALGGALLEVPEHTLAALEEGTYYRFQIVGLEVVTAAGEPLGRVAEVLETGANDVYIVRSEDAELLLPATEDVVRQVDVARGRMVVELIEGLERRPLKRRRQSSGSDGPSSPW